MKYLHLLALGTLGLAALGTALILDDVAAPAARASALVRADVDRPVASASHDVGGSVALDVTPPFVVSDVTGTARTLELPAAPSAAPGDKTAKKVAKLDKKLAKQQAKLAKLEAKADALAAEIDALEAELDAALLLPEDDPKAAKAKAKLIAKLQKKLAKFGKKDDKLTAKQVKTTDKISDVAGDLEDLSPGHVAGAVPGLLVAEQMSVVTADEGLSAFTSTPTFDPESDYVTDSASTYVWDEAMEPVQQVNALLCYIASTGYDDMLNRGAYLAQVNEERCETGADNSASSSEEGQSSGADATEPSLWTVESSRGSAESLQLVKMWVPESEDPHDGAPSPDGTAGGGPGDEQPDGHIRAKVVVEEGVSPSNPFGTFTMNWARFTESGKPAVDDGFGNLTTLGSDGDELGFSMYEGRGDVDQPVPQGEDASRVRVDARMSTDLTSGYAKVRVEQRYGEFIEPGGEGTPLDSGIMSQDYLIAFNETHMLRDDGETTTCFSRVDFRDNVWRYGLYHASGELAGQRVERNEGFGFVTEDGQYGWAGYHGVWAPYEADLQTGDVVTKEVWGEEDGETFSLFVAPGRLIRNERLQIPLIEIDGMVFEWFEDPLDGFSPPQMWRVSYSHGTGEWLKIAVFDHEFGVWVESIPQQQEAIDVESIGWLSFWADALGGPAFYEYGAGVVTVWTETFVDGSDPMLAEGDLALFGYHDVIKPAIGLEDAELGDVFLPPAGSVEGAYPLVFDAETLSLNLLLEGSIESPVGFAEGVEPTAGPYTWGVRSGPLVTDTSGFSSPDDVWSASVFYTYETGPHEWNKLTALVDGDGEFVTFDPPLEFTYQHSTANDANGESDADGQTFLLRYYGFGDVGGIPFEPVDLDDDGYPDRWYPMFNIADGTTVGPEDEYVVRALDTEVTLVVDEQGCEGLDTAAAAALELPDASVFTMPDIGPEPEVDDAPAVIDGVLQAVVPAQP